MAETLSTRPPLASDLAAGGLGAGVKNLDALHLGRGVRDLRSPCRACSRRDSPLAAITTVSAASRIPAQIEIPELAITGRDQRRHQIRHQPQHQHLASRDRRSGR